MSTDDKYDYDPLKPTEEVLQQRLKDVTRHIQHVQQSCHLLGERLIATGEKDQGLRLIANGYIHDNSKLYSIEWDYLHTDVRDTNPQLFNAALTQHTKNNAHHPEYWDGITNMPPWFLAEMVCDWHGRSSEFGTGLREYALKTATKRFNFTPQSKVYKEIKAYMDLLLDNAFAPPK